MRNIVFLFCLFVLTACSSMTTGQMAFDQQLYGPATATQPAPVVGATPIVASPEPAPINCGWQPAGKMTAKLNFWPGLFGNPVSTALAVSTVAGSYADTVRGYALRELACAQAQGMQVVYHRIANGGSSAKFAKLENNVKRLTVAWAKDELQARGQGGSVGSAATMPEAAPTAAPVVQPAVAAPNSAPVTAPAAGTEPSQGAPTSACDMIRNATDFTGLAQGFEKLAAETADPVEHQERDTITKDLKRIAAAPQGHVVSAYKNALRSHCQ